MLDDSALTLALARLLVGWKTLALVGCILAPTIGTVVLVLGHARRYRGGSLCHACGYDLRGTRATTCSECGARVDPDTDRRPIRGIWRWVVILWIVGLAWPTYQAVLWSRARGWTPPLPRYRVEVLRIYSTGHVLERLNCRNPRDPEYPGVLRILDAEGVERMKQSSTGMSSSIAIVPHLDLPEDINGDGWPELVTSDTSSGTGCYASYAIHQMDPGGPVQQIAGVGGFCGAVFRDLDGDGVLEHESYDGNLKYALACGACLRSFPRIVLRQHLGGWVLAPEIMREPPPDRAAFEELVDRLRSENWTLPIDPDDLFAYWNKTVGQLWEEMIRLIYTGNARTALELQEAVWPSELPHGRASLTYFVDTIRSTTPYWDDLDQMQDPAVDWPAR